MQQGQAPRWAVGVTSLACALALLGVACSSDSGSDASTTTAKDKGDGAQVFEENCATCHAADGSGGQGPPIGDGVAKGKYTETEMIELVTKGRNGMPAFGEKLTDEQIAAVVAFVREDLGKGPSGKDDDGDATTERGSLEGIPPEAEVEGDWALANRDYLSQRAVTEDAAITSETVGDLELDWTYDVPGGATFGNLTTTPLVSGDHVYVGDLTTRVHAIDRATGDEEFVVGDDASIFGPTGVGLGWGRLYGTKADDSGRGTLLVAYDADSGEELWTTDLGANGSDLNIQPLPYDGLVFASTGGYGAGSIGTLYAVDAETGAIVWDFPITDEEIWGNPDVNGGGGIWYPPTIDVDRGVVYVGTGNPYPFPGAEGFPNGASRPGDNKWTDSILALDVQTGELLWGHQAIAHDLFDRDSMLTGRVDVEIDGEERSLAISTGKLGVVTALDADSGEVVWKTPVGTHENDELTEIDGPTLVYPGSLGGVQTPLAIADGTLYLCVENAPSEYAGPEETSYGFSVKLGTADAELVAVDAATGEIEWSSTLDGDAFGGATVSGDLVFTSTFGGEVLALDRETGEQVWSYDAGGGINGWITVAGDELYVPVGMADPPQLLRFSLPGD